MATESTAESESPSPPVGGAGRQRWLETRSGALVASGASLVALTWLALVPRSYGSATLGDFALARSVWHAPLATLLVPSARPLLTLLEALPALVGLRALALVGAVAGALSVYLAAELAHALDVGCPNVAGWLVATSLSLGAAALGAPERALAGLCVTAALLWYFSERSGAAWALGVLPLVHPELLFVTLGVAAWDVLNERRVRRALAMLLPVAGYAAALTLYHRGAGWIGGLVATSAPQAGLRHELRSAIGVVVASSPVLASFCLFGMRPSKSRVWLLGVIVVAACCAGGAAASALLLPLAGVLAASALNPSRDTRPGRGWGWFGAAAVAAGCAFAGAAAELAALAVVAAAGARLVLARPRAAQALLVGGAVAVAGVQLSSLAARQRRVDARARGELHALKSSGLWRGQALYTDRPSLRCERCRDGRGVVLLLDPTRAARFALAPRPGERALFARDLGRSRVVLDFSRARVDRGALYALSGDARSAAWRRRLEAAGAIALRISRLTVYFWPASGQRLPNESPEL